MILDRVTMTGSDSIRDWPFMVQATIDFPFVEWGILLSKSKHPTRFASYEYLYKLLGAMHCHSYTPPQLRLSHVFELRNKLCGHICGQWVHDLLHGKNSIELEMPGILSLFSRLQLNFHGMPHEITNAALEMLKFDPHFVGKQIIFQNDGVKENRGIFEVARDYGINAVQLFDMSHGAGVSPDSWPSHPGGYVGYAGGLGQDNLKDELDKIRKVTEPWDAGWGGCRLWIDMETKIRSENDTIFDMGKIRNCLTIAAEYVKISM